MDKTEIEKYLKTRGFGRNLVCLDKTASTNHDAKMAASSGCPHGHTIVADEQTEGRGRLDHAWISPSGINIYVSIVLKPNVPTSIFPQIPIICAIALHQALVGMEPSLNISLKWPNDLLLTENRRKISGILCEGVTTKERSLAVVAGIGINVNGSLEDFSENLRHTAGSLKMATGRAWSREQVLAVFLNRFEIIFDEWQEAQSLQLFMDYWNRHDLLAGQRISVVQDSKTEEGVAIGMDDEGRLLLEISGNVKLIHAGDVHLEWKAESQKH